MANSLKNKILHENGSCMAKNEKKQKRFLKMRRRVKRKRLPQKQ
ncbi:hypothetical protein Cabys_1920 [Caldithrix abyssi DSM 13497]|uniref:Uncharacterized protein n=1 Tax=Caldithrix abyssi DSM 13497 TaxID=880073 RepID=A0A1J1C7K5_CALAY|nr:hypothetical protein Cabys_1920 [Caldithrix abyssi DSM 13497]